MRARGVIPRASAILCAAVVLTIIDTSAASAQRKTDCDLKVKPAPGDIGYKKRSYGCEGMYVGLQSAPLGVQVVSIVRGTLAFDSATHLRYVFVGADSKSVSSDVRVIGRARRANLHWAFDGEVSPGRPLTWDLREVIHNAELKSETVGLYGLVSPAAGATGGPSFVPVAIRGSPDADPTKAGESVELIVRIPAAAALCWSIARVSEERKQGIPKKCTAIDPFKGNADGYFQITIADPEPGEHQLALRWRVRGTHEWPGAPVHLRLHL